MNESQTADRESCLKIRLRVRFNASPPAGLRQSWDEWQVVEGRRVVARYDTMALAIKNYPLAKVLH